MSEGSSDSDAETKREQKPSCPAAKKFETCFQTGSLVSTGTDFQPNGKSDTAAAPDIIPKRLEVVKREHQGDELRDSSYNSLHLGESTDDIFQGQEHGCVDHVISLVKEQFPALGPSHLFSAHDQSVASTPAIASFTSTLTSGGQTEPPSKSDAAAQALAKLATKSFDLPADRLPATPRLIPLNDGINELIPDIVVTGYVVSDGTAYEPSLQPAQTPWIEDSMLSDTDEIDLDLARRFGASF